MNASISRSLYLEGEKVSKKGRSLSVGEVCVMQIPIGAAGLPLYPRRAYAMCIVCSLMISHTVCKYMAYMLPRTYAGKLYSM